MKQKKQYLIYKTTNLLNKKFYIGKHITNNIDDGYLGSGKLLQKAIEKYGKNNFKKEILFIFDNELEMNKKEIELLTEEKIYPNNKKSYNLNLGGEGSFEYINKNNLSNTEKLKKRKSEKMKEYWTTERKIKKSVEMKKYNKKNGTERYSISLKNRYENMTQEEREKFSQKMSLINKNINKRLDASEKIKKKWKDSDFLSKMKKRKPRGGDGSALKKKWEDPVFREKMLTARKKKKNETQ